MTECESRGCRNLAWKCADCGRTDATVLTMYKQWISVDELVPPAMQTVLLCINGKVLPGWNESVQPEEDPSYCTWEGDPFGAEGVTHWMQLPSPPKEENGK